MKRSRIIANKNKRRAIKFRFQQLRSPAQVTIQDIKDLFFLCRINPVFIIYSRGSLKIIARARMKKLQQLQKFIVKNLLPPGIILTFEKHEGKYINAN
jgi:hypothetical protein